MFLGPTILRNFAFELLTGDGPDRCVGAGRIVLAHFLSGRGRKSLVAAPLRVNRHSLNNPMPGKGREHGAWKAKLGEGFAALRAVNRMFWRRKGMGQTEGD